MTPSEFYNVSAIIIVASIPLIYVSMASYGREMSLGFRSVILSYLIWGAFFLLSVSDLHRLSSQIVMPFIMVAFTFTFFMGCASISGRQPGGAMAVTVSLVSLVLFFAMTSEGKNSFLF